MPPKPEGSVATRLVLSNVSMATVPLEEMIDVAAAAGFDAISVLGRNLRSARRRGFSDADIAKRAADHGIAVECVEAAGDWLSEPPDGPRWMSPVYTSDEYIDIAAALGSDTVVAVHFGERRPLEATAEAFAGLCDRAAERGLRVALEFPAWATIGDVASAWCVVRTADRDNGGLLVDLWHHRRGGNDDEALGKVDPAKVFCLQVCDATAEPVGPLIEDVTRRQLPGDGDLGVPGFLEMMREMGVSASVGVEVFDDELLATGAQPAASRLMCSLKGVLGQN